MIRRLHILCPVCIICLAVLISCVFALNSNAALDGSSGDQAEKVDYSEGTWSANRIAVPAAAQETSAVLTLEFPAEEDAEVADSATAESITLTDYEREFIERIVMCEAGGEGTKGQMMVAQCILEGMHRFNYSIDEYVVNYKVHYTSYSNVTDEVKESVSRVFDDGERVINERADLWYNPAITPSEWHEQQQYVTTVGSHRFFWMQGDLAA